MPLETLPDQLYDKFARVGQALSSPTRLRMLNLLAQTERSVDDLAARLGESRANTSAHLKVLRQAHLVEGRRDGRRVFYGVAGDQALRLWLALRDMGLAEIPEAREAMRQYASEPAAMGRLDAQALAEKVRRGDVVLIDLRPADEYAAGHLPAARSVPFDELEQRLEDLPRDKELIAYCRGPYCVAAIKGVRALREAGLDARRLYEGVAEWRAAGRRLESSLAETGS